MVPKLYFPGASRAGQIDMHSPARSPSTPMDRLKVLINSSTPIVVMETIEECGRCVWFESLAPVKPRDI